jgi:hypothetical protein
MFIVEQLKYVCDSLRVCFYLKVKKQHDREQHKKLFKIYMKKVLGIRRKQVKFR